MTSAQGLRGGLVAQIKVKHITARLADMDLSVLSRKGFFFFSLQVTRRQLKKEKTTPFVSYRHFFSLSLVLVSHSIYLGTQIMIAPKEKIINVGSYLVSL